MALDDIPIDFRRVARCKVAGYAEAAPDSVKIGRLFDRDGKSCVLQMSRPASAAAAIRTFMNDDGWGPRRGGKRRYD